MWGGPSLGVSADLIVPTFVGKRVCLVVAGVIGMPFDPAKGEGAKLSNLLI